MSCDWSEPFYPQSPSTHPSVLLRDLFIPDFVVLLSLREGPSLPFLVHVSGASFFPEHGKFLDLLQFKLVS